MVKALRKVNHCFRSYGAAVCEGSVDRNGANFISKEAVPPWLAENFFK